jgi:hypothetical protein
VTTMNWYNLDLTQYPKDFKVGDKVRVFVGVGQGGSETWTTITSQHSEDTFVVEAEFIKWGVLPGTIAQARMALEEKGWLLEIEGKTHIIAHIDDLKSEAQAREESDRYHMEEWEVGLL